MVRMGPGLHGNLVATMTAKVPVRACVDRGHATAHLLAAGGKTARVPRSRCPTVRGKYFPKQACGIKGFPFIINAVAWEVNSKMLKVNALFYHSVNYCCGEQLQTHKRSRK